MTRVFDIVKLTVSSCLLSFACSDGGGGEHETTGGAGGSAAESTGGSATASGGAATQGGVSNGAGGATTAGVSGAVSMSGGATATGGSSAGAAMGGAASGGKSGSGGATTGGTTTGGAASGGKSGSGGTTGGTAMGGATTGGAVGGTVTWTATDYASRKWARWPIPNPPSMNLPHPMSYTAGANGVTDNVTGLVWQKSTNTATTNWQSALDYCKTLGEGWSLPTRIELSSIVDNTRSGGKVDPVFTFGKSAGWTWASTPWVVNQRKNLMGDAALSWFINFAVGDSNNSLSQTATSAYSRCVKILPTQTLPAQHYTVANGEVKDNYTGLVWQQGHSGSTASLSFDQADAYCKALPLNAQAWRLPSLNELASIVDDVPTGDVSPAVDHATFPDTSPNLQYWSATPYGTSTSERWTLNFMDGFTAHRATSTPFLARCVR